MGIENSTSSNASDAAQRSDGFTSKTSTDLYPQPDRSTEENEESWAAPYPAGLWPEAFESDWGANWFQHWLPFASWIWPSAGSIVDFEILSSDNTSEPSPCEIYEELRRWLSGAQPEGGGSSEVALAAPDNDPQFRIEEQARNRMPLAAV